MPKPKTEDPNTETPTEVTPPPADTKTPAPTPEELKAQHTAAVDAIMAKTFGTKPAPKEEAPAPPEPQPEETPTEEPPAPKEKPVAEPPPAKPATVAEAIKATPPTPPEKPERAEVDEEVLDRVADRALEKAGVKPAKEAPAAPALPPGLSLQPKDQYLLKVLRQMESMNLDPSHKGLADRVISHWQAEQQWIKDWQAKHPGEKFSEDNDDYVAWVEDNEPTFDDYHYKEAEWAMRRGEWEKEQEQKTNAVKKELTEQQRFEKEMPGIEQSALTGVVDLIAQAAPEHLKPLLQVDGKVAITQKFDEAMQEQAPEARQILIEEAEELQVVLRALELGSRFPDSAEAKRQEKAIKLRQSDRHIVPAVQLDALAVEIEQELSALPKEESMIEGRKFVTHQTMLAALQSIKESDLEPHRKQAAINKYLENHWALEPAQIRNGIIAKYTQKASKRIGQVHQWVEKKGKAAPKAAPSGGTPDDATNSASKAKPRSPSSASASDTAHPKVAPKSLGAEDDKLIARRMGWE